MHTLKQWLESKRVNDYKDSDILEIKDLITSLPEAEQMLLELIGEDEQYLDKSIKESNSEWLPRNARNQRNKEVRDIIHSFFNNK